MVIGHGAGTILVSRVIMRLDGFGVEVMDITESPVESLYCVE